LSRLECLVKATLLPLLFLLTTCSGNTTYYLKPTSDTQCPAHPCLTLSEYAQQPYPYGTSNTTLLLLPGDHTLTVNFTVENITDFEIRAHFSPNVRRHAVMIVCQGLVAQHADRLCYPEQKSRMHAKGNRKRAYVVLSQGHHGRILSGLQISRENH